MTLCWCHCVYESSRQRDTSTIVRCFNRYTAGFSRYSAWEGGTRSSAGAHPHWIAGVAHAERSKREIDARILLRLDDDTPRGGRQDLVEKLPQLAVALDRDDPLVVLVHALHHQRIALLLILERVPTEGRLHLHRLGQRRPPRRLRDLEPHR